WRLSVFGKVGLVIWESEIDALDEDFTEEDIIYGLGARFRLLGNLSVFAEWEQIASDIETVSLGAHLQF
ncbi:MAG: porin family protein, partial [Acidobacteriota bacterium]